MSLTLMGQVCKKGNLNSTWQYLFPFNKMKICTTWKKKSLDKIKDWLLKNWKSHAKIRIIFWHHSSGMEIMFKNKWISIGDFHIKCHNWYQLVLNWSKLYSKITSKGLKDASKSWIDKSCRVHLQIQRRVLKILD